VWAISIGNIVNVEFFHGIVSLQSTLFHPLQQVDKEHVQWTVVWTP